MGLAVTSHRASEIYFGPDFLILVFVGVAAASRARRAARRVAMRSIAASRASRYSFIAWALSASLCLSAIVLSTFSNTLALGMHFLQIFNTRLLHGPTVIVPLTVIVP
jgi:hypothetical protein